MYSYTLSDPVKMKYLLVLRDSFTNFPALHTPIFSVKLPAIIFHQGLPGAAGFVGVFHPISRMKWTVHWPETKKEAISRRNSIFPGTVRAKLFNSEIWPSGIANIYLGKKLTRVTNILIDYSGLRLPKLCFNTMCHSSQQNYGSRRKQRLNEN